MLTSKDKTIEKLEAEIQSLKLQQLQGNDECTTLVLSLMDEIRELKENLNVVESILRTSLPVVGVDKFLD